MPTVAAAGAGKAVGKDAALQILAKSLTHVAKDEVLRLALLRPEAKSLRIAELERASFNEDERLEVKVLESIRATNVSSNRPG